MEEGAAARAASAARERQGLGAAILVVAPATAGLDLAEEGRGEEQRDPRLGSAAEERERRRSALAHQQVPPGQPCSPGPHSPHSVPSGPPRRSRPGQQHASPPSPRPPHRSAPSHPRCRAAVTVCRTEKSSSRTSSSRSSRAQRSRSRTCRAAAGPSTPSRSSTSRSRASRPSSSTASSTSSSRTRSRACTASSSRPRRLESPSYFAVSSVAPRSPCCNNAVPHQLASKGTFEAR